MTSPSWIEPPPPRQTGGMGCFAKGCLILLCFCFVLGLAGVGGAFYAVRYLRGSYFSSESVQLPANNATEQDQQMARAKWKIFERSARAHQPAQIEMTESELNALIASEPKLRGRARVSISDDSVRLQLSFPLENSRWLRGRYVNGECSIQAGPTGNPAEARITSVVVNERAVPDEVLTWHGPYSIRRYIEEWTDENDLKTFEIRDGKVILETKGSG
jgi:hypothetical protein